MTKITQVGETVDEKAPVLVVEYNDIDGLSEILKEQEVHTVISAIQVTSPEPGASEVNLVKAAVKAGVPKRFISSDWGVNWPEKYALSSVKLPQRS